MSGEDFDSLRLVGRRVPDFSIETDANGHKHSVELPGHYEVGFLTRGVFRVLMSFPAAGLLADIERAKQPDASE